MSDLRRGNLLLAQHATLRAQLRARPRARARILAAMQLDEATWAQADREWSAFLDGAAGRGQVAELVAWQAAFAAARAELEAEVEAEPDKGVAAAAAPPRVAPPAPPSSPQPIVQLHGAAARPTYLQQGLPSAPTASAAFTSPASPSTPLPAPPYIAPGPDSPRPRSRPHPTSTMVAPAPASAPTPLPFGRVDLPSAPPPSNPALSPRVPTGTMPLETPSSSTAPDRLEGLSLEEYARLEAELAAYPAHRTDVLGRYRIPSEEHYRHIATSWKRCIAELGLYSTYIGLFARHRQAARPRG